MQQQRSFLRRQQERDAFYTCVGRMWILEQDKIRSTKKRYTFTICRITYNMQDSTSAKTGTLYIVATPIGNLEDITLRAIRILKEADYIAAEDTRHTKKLLNHFGIDTNLISYYREQEQRRADQIVRFLEEGQDVAIVTDAGTPAISDPGTVVVRKARDRGLKI